MRYNSLTPPKVVRHGDIWRKKDEGTLWKADIDLLKWLPINSYTSEIIDTPPIPFPPKTQVVT